MNPMANTTSSDVGPLIEVMNVSVEYQMASRSPLASQVIDG